jgi:Histidine kinase
MNTLAHEIPATQRHWHLAEWMARAWRRMGWRHVLLALAVQIVRQLFGPLGGVFLYAASPQSTWGALVVYLNGHWAINGIPIIYCVLVADEAFDDGIPPLRAYGLAVIALAAFCPVADWLLAGSPVGWPRYEARDIAWWGLALLFQGSLGTAIYAYWRTTQRAMRRVEAAETERVRDGQRIQTARLLALQARVEPQMLFDALGRVGKLQVHDPQAADALLADLIALLRAMQSGPKADNSTVEREFALVEAWLRVARDPRHSADRVQLQMTPEARPISIAPMLVLPLLRSVLVVPRATQGAEWALSAHLASRRLIVTLHSIAGAETAGPFTSMDLAPVHDRLAQLFGRTARLSVSSERPGLILDLPYLREDGEELARPRPELVTCEAP